jgi:hypothetical protein
LANDPFEVNIEGAAVETVVFQDKRAVALLVIPQIAVEGVVEVDDVSSVVQALDAGKAIGHILCVANVVRRSDHRADFPLGGKASR